MIKLTDAEMTQVANKLTTNPECRIVMIENGNYLYEADGTTHKICQGKLIVMRGKVRLYHTCGEPCTFVCKTSRAFCDTVDTVQTIVRAINEIQK